MINHNVTMSGKLSTKLVRNSADAKWKIKNALRPAYVWGSLSNNIARNFSSLSGIPTMTAELTAVVIASDGTVTNYGTLSKRVVTSVFANYVATNLATEETAFGDFKFHESGTGTTAENASNTALVTSAGARVTGTQVASTNTYTSVATLSYTSSLAITEHGLFNASTSGTLLDRSVFSAINVVNGDSIQFTYTLTVNSGG